jgi:putative nucleotidyltransferase with HDIG domain
VTDRVALRNRSESSVRPALLAFVLVTTVVGALVVSRAVHDLLAAPFDYRLPLFALLTFVSSRFAIRLPGQTASVSLSVVFVFAILFVLGPAAATVVVTLDAIVRAFTERQTLYRVPLEVLEPAISTWTAGFVYVTAIALLPPLAAYDTLRAWLPAVGMTATYFTLHSVLTALAQGLESGESPRAIWRRHALLLAVKHYTAASLAILGGATGETFSPVVFSMLAPLLVLSYVAYREAAARVEAAHRHVEDVEHLYHATVETLAVAVDAKDQVTHGHIRRVQRHALAVAKELGMADPVEVKALESAALLHDVGKLAMPDYVLNKPGTLSHGEYETIKLHATKGATILKSVEFPYPVVPTVRHHHEWWNGRGYPDGLAGESIPLGARILAVVDCFDALTSDRPYRRRLRDDEAIEMLRERAGTAYDPRIVEGFIKLIPELRLADEKADATTPHVTPVLPEAALTIDPVAEHASGASHREVVGRLRLAGLGTIDKVIKLFHGTEACLFAVSPGGDVVWRAVATPVVESAIADTPLPVGKGLSGWVAANRHTIVNSDPGLDLGDAAPLLGLRSATATPVFAFGTVVAVLTLYNPDRGAFSERQVRIIGVLAQEIGTELVRIEHSNVERTSTRALVARFS